MSFLTLKHHCLAVLVEGIKAAYAIADTSRSIELITDYEYAIDRIEEAPDSRNIHWIMEIANISYR